MLKKRSALKGSQIFCYYNKEKIQISTPKNCSHSICVNLPKIINSNILLCAELRIIYNYIVQGYLIVTSDYNNLASVGCMHTIHTGCCIEKYLRLKAELCYADSIL